MSKKNEQPVICKNCKGDGLLSIKYEGDTICPICEGTGVKLTDKHTEAAGYIGGELFDDDPNYIDLE